MPLGSTVKVRHFPSTGLLLAMCSHLTTCSLVDTCWMPNKCKHVDTRNYLIQPGHSKMFFCFSYMYVYHIIYTEYLGTSIVLYLCMITPMQLPYCWTKSLHFLTSIIEEVIVDPRLSKMRNAKSITIHQTYG